MGRGSKGGYKSASYQLFKAKNKVDDLQGVFSELQCARKEGRVKDVAVSEEQVHQILREWRAELNAASPAASLFTGSLNFSELSSDMRRLLQLHEEEDDATSVLATPHSPKLQKEEYNLRDDGVGFQEGLYLDQALNDHSVDRVDRPDGILSESLLHLLEMAWMHIPTLRGITSL